MLLSDEHEVVFYKSCGDKDTMDTIETLVFQKLKDYREQANRERFVVPEGRSVDMFVDVIKDCVKFVS